MLKLRTPENLTFKNTPTIGDTKSEKKERYHVTKMLNGNAMKSIDETDCVVVRRKGDANLSRNNCSEVDSGRESLSSTNAFLMEDDTTPGKADDEQPKVKVVGELLKKDVKSCDVPPAPIDGQVLKGCLDLRELIIAQDIVIGSPPFDQKSDSKSYLKKKPVVSDGVRKKRIQRVAEHVDTKQKVVNVLTKKSAPVEKTPPPVAKDSKIVKKFPISRSNSKDSVSGVVTPNDKSKKKLVPKLSLDSKTKEIKKVDLIRNTVKNDDRKKLSKPVPLSSPKVRTNINGRINRTKGDNQSSDVNPAAYYEFYNAAIHRKCNADAAENSFYKDISQVFTPNVSAGEEGCVSCLPICGLSNSNKQVIDVVFFWNIEIGISLSDVFNYGSVLYCE